MKGMSSIWIYSGYNSKVGVTYTTEVNFSPRYTVAQASIFEVSGGGLHKTGVAGYRYRPTPDGPEQSVNFGSWPAWRGYVYRDRMTSVTFGTAVGARQSCRVIGNMFFW
jgi:hypothetical protein